MSSVSAACDTSSVTGGRYPWGVRSPRAAAAQEAAAVRGVAITHGVAARQCRNLWVATAYWVAMWPQSTGGRRPWNAADHGIAAGHGVAAAYGMAAWPQCIQRPQKMGSPKIMWWPQRIGGRNPWDGRNAVGDRSPWSGRGPGSAE